MNPNTDPQPLSKQDSKRAYSIATEQIETLRGAAMFLRDMVAAERLLQVATTAARAVHSLWNDTPPSAFSAGVGQELRDLNREMLRQHVFPRQPVIPLLADGYGHISPDQIGMLDGIRHRGFKWKGQHRKGAEDDIVRKLIVEVIEPEIQQIQMTRGARDSIDIEVQGLPPKSLRNRHARARVGAYLVWRAFKTEIRRKGSRLYKVANPERQLLKDQEGREADFQHWLKNRADRGDTRGGKGELNAADAKKAKGWRKRIREMKIEDRHFIRGLREALQKRYSSTLAG